MTTVAEASVARPSNQEILDDHRLLEAKVWSKLQLNSRQAEALQTKTILIERTFPAVRPDGTSYGSYYGCVALVAAYDPRTGEYTFHKPGKGGLRIAADVTGSKMSWMAEVMLRKNQMLEQLERSSGPELSFIGGKAGIRHHATSDNTRETEDVVRGFAVTFSDVLGTRYVSATDGGSTSRHMDIIAETTKNPASVTGKSLAAGGLPGQALCTGRGVAKAVSLVAADLGITLGSSFTVGTHGLGKVGWAATKFLAESGCRAVIGSDVQGGIANTNGLNLELLGRHVRKHGTIATCDEAGRRVGPWDPIYAPVTALVLASTEPGAVNAQNAEKVQARIIVGGANEAVTPAGAKRYNGTYAGDLWPNSGGLWSSYLAYLVSTGQMPPLTEAQLLQSVDQEQEQLFGKMQLLQRRYGLNYQEAAPAVSCSNHLASVGLPLTA